VGAACCKLGVGVNQRLTGVINCCSHFSGPRILAWSAFWLHELAAHLVPPFLLSAFAGAKRVENKLYSITSSAVQVTLIILSFSARARTGPCSEALVLNLFLDLRAANERIAKHLRKWILGSDGPEKWIPAVESLSRSNSAPTLV
jgi:hypothetical protein